MMTQLNPASSDKHRPTGNDLCSATVTEQTAILEIVAKIVAASPSIGIAWRALQQAGLSAKLAGNRISINDTVFAQYLCSPVGSVGEFSPAWLIYAPTGGPPLVTSVREMMPVDKDTGVLSVCSTAQPQAS